MKPFTEFNAVKNIRYVLCDIDDTITTDGKLSAAAYSALWQLTEHGIHVIPVTGRPAGWCDLIVRQWPVRAVIGENGAFAMYFSKGQLHTLLHPSVAHDTAQRLKTIETACLIDVPGCRVAKDQFARKYDLAIDFREDPPYLDLAAAQKIKQICESYGAIAKISSIHVNTWFGNYDKLSMTQLFFKEVLQEPALKSTALFFGDSCNDEPMFAFFPFSVAVANILPFVESLTHLPSYVTKEESGAGFAAAVAHLLEAL